MKKQRNKRQHHTPKFYLENFTNDEGFLWTHDSRSGEARQNLPKNTGRQKYFYSPEVEDGERFDDIDEFLTEVEGIAAPLIKRLLNCEKLNAAEKADLSVFIASMFVRSPAQIRQIATDMGNTASWMMAHYAESELNAKHAKGENTDVIERVLKELGEKDALKMNVDRRAGLMSFVQIDPISRVVENMTWSFEISKDIELVTSDNSVFWVAVEPVPKSPYGFGLAHKHAVIPFPLSPEVMLRIEHNNPNPWQRTVLDKNRAKLANRMRAQHKDHCLYYRTHHEGIHKLGMKYAKPVQQLVSSYEGPKVDVVRKLKD